MDSFKKYIFKIKKVTDNKNYMFKLKKVDNVCTYHHLLHKNTYGI